MQEEQLGHLQDPQSICLYPHSLSQILGTGSCPVPGFIPGPQQSERAARHLPEVSPYSVPTPLPPQPRTWPSFPR